MSGYFKSDECRAMVLSPKLPPFFSCSDHFLMTDELLRFQDAVACCSSCIRNCSSFGISEVECSHGRTKLHAVNPKVPTITTETGDSYTKDPGKFLVTNELGVAPFSLINALSELKKKDHSVSELATREFTFTQAEVIRVTFSGTSCLLVQHKFTDVKIDFLQVLNLLRAALVSREALTLACLVLANQTKETASSLPLSTK